MLQKFIVAQTVFVAIVDEVLNEKVSARTRVSVGSRKEKNMSDRPSTSHGPNSLPDDLNGRVVRFLLVEAVDELVEGLVRRCFELWEVVAQVGDFIHRVFTLKPAKQRT